MSPGVVSNFDFEYRLVLHTKRYKLKLTISRVCLEKCNFLQTKPNIGNIYIYQIKEFFAMSMDSESLPQNKASFGLDQGLKFICTGECANFFGDET